MARTPQDRCGRGFCPLCAAPPPASCTSPHPPTPGFSRTSTVDWSLREAANSSRSQVRRELCHRPTAPRLLKPGGGGWGQRHLSPSSGERGGGGARGRRWPGSQSCLCSAWKLGTPRSCACAFLRRRSTYFLEGVKGALGYTTTGSGVAGADYSLRPTRLIVVPCFPPFPPLYIYPPSASARCWRRPQRRSPPHPGTEPPGLLGTPERGMGA